MRGNQHFLMTFFSVASITIPSVILSVDLSLLVFLFFSGMGSQLPDVDIGWNYSAKGKISGTSAFLSKKGSHALNQYFGRVLWLVGQITYVLIYLPYSLVLGLIFRRKWDSHRGLFHSLFAAIYTSVIFYLLITIILGNFGVANVSNIASVISFGIFVGFVFHLLQDSLTLSGIEWFSPLSTLKISGNHITNSDKGQLIANLFIVYLMLLAIAPSVYAFVNGINYLPALLDKVYILLVLGWVVFMLTKGIRIRF
ncbi:MAG: metal-dependent hydrolase [Candidatus Micrarchaeia archaeon]